MQEQVGDNEGSWQSFADSRMMCNETPACPVAYQQFIMTTSPSHLQTMFSLSIRSEWPTHDHDQETSKERNPWHSLDAVWCGRLAL